MTTSKTGNTPPQKNGPFSDTVRIMWATETSTNWSLGLFDYSTGQWLDAKTRKVFTDEVIGWEELPRKDIDGRGLVPG